jgi:methionyl aminopeptidase
MSKITIKTPEELNIIREGGKILSEIIGVLVKEIKEGNTSIEIDKYANFLCKRYDVKPAFLGQDGFPATICANLNEIIVHGVPTSIRFKNGDIFGLDMGIIFRGFYLDSSTTVEIGLVLDQIKEFNEKTLLSMNQGIEAARVGNTIGDISFAMRRGLLSENFSLMKDFVGHGIGKALWEAPQIPAVGIEPGKGDVIKEGMVFAIESMSVLGPTNQYEIGKDRWTVYTKGKKYLSSLYEHTVIVTKDGPEIVTV